MTHEMQIVDKIALHQWEELIGGTIHGDRVRMTHDFYVRHAREIQFIQMGAAFRIKFGTVQP